MARTTRTTLRPPTSQEVRYDIGEIKCLRKLTKGKNDGIKCQTWVKIFVFPMNELISQ